MILQKSLVCMKTGSFWFQFQWSSSYDVIYNRPAYAYWWLGAKQGTFHYMWVYGDIDFTNICVTRPRWIKTGVKWKPHSSALLNHTFNTLRPRRNEHFADDIFKRIFFNENVWITIKISLKFVAKGPINNIPALVQIMAWRRPGDKPSSEPVMVSLLTHICVARPQWVDT